MVDDAYLRKQLGENERMLYKAHPHWIVLLGRVWQEALLFVVLLVLLIFAGTSWLKGHGWVAWGYLLLLLPVGSAAIAFWGWATRKFIVTNRRVVQLSGILSKTVVDSSLEKVNDVRLTQPLLGRMLGYGNVEIMTAAEAGLDLFTRISDPLQFKTALLNAKEELERELGNRG